MPSQVASDEDEGLYTILLQNSCIVDVNTEVNVSQKGKNPTPNC